MRERRGRAAGPGRLLTRPILVLIPLAVAAGLLSGSARDAWPLAFGGLHAALVGLTTVGRDRIPPEVLVGGALWQSLFALLVLSGLWRRRDLLLGRAAG
jgi:hypothetical protein